MTDQCVTSAYTWLLAMGKEDQEDILAWSVIVDSVTWCLQTPEFRVLLDLLHLVCLDLSILPDLHMVLEHLYAFLTDEGTSVMTAEWGKLVRV